MSDREAHRRRAPGPCSQAVAELGQEEVAASTDFYNSSCQSQLEPGGGTCLSSPSWGGETNGLIRAQPSAYYIPEAEALMEGAYAGGQECTPLLCDLPTWASVFSTFTRRYPACPASQLGLGEKVFCRSQGQ